MEATACGVCRLHQDQFATKRYEIIRSPHWILRHHPDPAPLVGWLLLDAQRHIGGPSAFNPEEASRWGGAVQQASQLVQWLTGCDRVYAIAFGEGARHLHLHLIPRFAGETASEAWAVADLYRAVTAGIRPAADPSQVADLVDRGRTFWPELGSLP
ncbi:diadenosine tetraphosphate hydrolase [Synechococcus lacustris C3-12m-Tous]|uniref:diadenosine tetraphosphate hydrolase n=1 Tax=Synechococcus lacustris TaxID=2116544 RepID=UPI0020CD4D5B|nr:diadenosine tetraphosphate hydrolase [Synechococcus lacustris]MCP9926107.1 diadenosine tetraphosphate hydrolase [Synechococcus lacustris C3-12m-Tous]